MRIKFLLLISILLTIQGCNHLFFSSPKTDQKTPTPFSFVDNAPNNVNLKYLLRMSRYDKIIKSTSIPVFIMDQNELSYKLPDKLKTTKLYGMFISNNFDPNWPKEFIFINKNTTPEQIITTYFHEYQHYKCIKYNCFCINNLVFKKMIKLLLLF